MSSGRSTVRWPHLRAAFVLLHVVAITVAALPSPIGMTDRSDWRTPEVEAELTQWARRLSSVGIETDSDALRHRLYPIVARWARAHQAARRPFRPYYECCGTDQSWRLFIAPNRHPFWFSVDVRDDDGWQPVYREHSSEHAWMRSALRTDRMRALTHLYGRPRYRTELQGLAQWFADEAAQQFPKATAIRLRHVRAPLPSVKQLREGHRPPGQLVSEIIRSIER